MEYGCNKCRLMFVVIVYFSGILYGGVAMVILGAAILTIALLLCNSTCKAGRDCKKNTPHLIVGAQNVIVSMLLGWFDFT